MLTEMLHENADEPYASEIAETLFKNSEHIETTTQLSDFIKKSLSEKAPFLKQLKNHYSDAFKHFVLQ